MSGAVLRSLDRILEKKLWTQCKYWLSFNLNNDWRLTTLIYCSICCLVTTLYCFQAWKRHVRKTCRAVLTILFFHPSAFSRRKRILELNFCKTFSPLCNYTHKLSSFKLYFSAFTEFSYFEMKALKGQMHDTSFAKTTRILQFVLFLCKLGVLLYIVVTISLLIG